jgi:hypothetical protein
MALTSKSAFLSLPAGLLLTLSISTYADESLATCEAEKASQMRLSQQLKRPSKAEYDPYTRRTYDRFDASAAKDEIERIDTWLWKNCRSYSEELRKIEQQYM